MLLALTLIAGIAMANRYKQLTLVERYQIQALRKLGKSAQHIATELKRGKTTILRDLKRCPAKHYCADKAHHNALNARYNAAKFTKRSAKVLTIVEDGLEIGLSPEQIAVRMPLESTQPFIGRQAVYDLVAHLGWRDKLPRKGKAYRVRHPAGAGAHLIPDRVDIDEPPASVDLKQEIGHWEADTVYGQDSYLVTLVERVSKFLLTVRVPNKKKTTVGRAIRKMLKPFATICKTITFDNGGEFAGHKKMAKALKCSTYFAKPYHSWQRGLNENTNGLLRRFFPKGMKIGVLPESRI